MCEALSSSGNVDKTSRRFESHFASWKPPLESNSCYCLLMSIACSSLENDLSKSSTQKSLNTASTTSGGKSRLLSLAVFPEGMSSHVRWRLGSKDVHKHLLSLPLSWLITIWPPPITKCSTVLWCYEGETLSSYLSWLQHHLLWIGGLPLLRCWYFLISAIITRSTMFHHS